MALSNDEKIIIGVLVGSVGLTILIVLIIWCCVSYRGRRSTRRLTTFRDDVDDIRDQKGYYTRPAVIGYGKAVDDFGLRNGRNSFRNEDLRETRQSFGDDNLRDTRQSFRDDNLRDTRQSFRDDNLRDTRQSLRDDNLRDTRQSFRDNNLRDTRQSLRSDDVRRTTSTFKQTNARISNSLDRDENLRSSGRSFRDFDRDNRSSSHGNGFKENSKYSGPSNGELYTLRESGGYTTEFNNFYPPNYEPSPITDLFSSASGGQDVGRHLHAPQYTRLNADPILNNNQQKHKHLLGESQGPPKQAPPPSRSSFLGQSSNSHLSTADPGQKKKPYVGEWVTRSEATNLEKFNGRALENGRDPFLWKDVHTNWRFDDRHPE